MLLFKKRPLHVGISYKHETWFWLSSSSVLLSSLLWRYWLAVVVGDKCVTKLSSFWCEDRLLCSHSCFFSLSLSSTVSPFVCELFCTFFPFHIHIFFFLLVCQSIVHPLLPSIVFFTVLFDFSPLFVDFMLEVSHSCSLNHCSQDIVNAT